ncbi:MAG TPA: VOC family protein [Pseudomonadales bacterium]|jgi:predicted enzyme related to lactoylglutathione lyase
MPDLAIGYVNVFVSDFDTALAFYRDKLGLEVAMADEEFGYASFDTKGVGFAIAAVGQDAEPAFAPGRHTGIGWGVESLDDAYETLRSTGVEFTAPPERQPWGGYMALFEDPDGNVFYLDELREH